MKKKLLVTTGIYPPDIGGPATFAKILVDELPNYGIGVDLLNFSSLLRYPSGFRHLLFFLRVLLRGWNVDVILALDPVSVGLPSSLASKILQKRFVLRVGGAFAWEQSTQRFGIEDPLDDFIHKRYGLRIEALKSIEKFVADKADLVIVPSRYLQYIVGNWVSSKEKIVVIYNSFEATYPKLDRISVREDLNLDGFVIVSVGRLLKLKGFRGLIRSISRLRKDIPDIRLFIIGSGPEQSTLERIVSEESCEDIVSLMGILPHNQTLQYILGADLFVLNSSVEGLSNSILEAMSLGTPIVATDVGGNPELIESGINGILISPNNAHQLAEAILELSQDKERRQAFVNTSYQMLKCFDRSNMLDETITNLFPEFEQA